MASVSGENPATQPKARPSRILGGVRAVLRGAVAAVGGLAVSLRLMLAGTALLDRAQTDALDRWADAHAVIAYGILVLFVLAVIVALWWVLGVLIAFAARLMGAPSAGRQKPVKPVRPTVPGGLEVTLVGWVVIGALAVGVAGYRISVALHSDAAPVAPAATALPAAK
jgi:uncharacterized iron-regulated membrane protein